MSSLLHTLIALDLPPLLASILVATPCALLGNFLLLRRLSLMGDAIAHAVLPGIVVAFLLFDSRAPHHMFIGALAAGLLTVALVWLIQRFTRVEPSAAIGVVFSILFALGVLLLEQAAARHVDLDADCILMGQLETLTWFPPETWPEFWEWRTFTGFTETLGNGRTITSIGFPRHVVSMAVVAALTIAFVTLLFKELRIAAFDPALATSLGVNASLMHALLMGFVAIAAVSAFEAVGSILVIAMLICPAATARLLTDRMGAQLIVSVIVALASSVGGYLLATRAPVLLGTAGALNAAGMITVTSGVLLTAAIFGAPRHGIIARRWRRLRLSIHIAREDLLAALYRIDELAEDSQNLQPPRSEMIRQIFSRRDLPGRLATRTALRRAEILRTSQPTADQSRRFELTTKGRSLAASIIRSHRLWETFLVEEVGLRPDHVHDTAMRLEHATTPQGKRIIPKVAPTSRTDPHGRTIPDEGDAPPPTE